MTSKFTPEQTLRRVAEHLARQGGPAMDGTFCMYRTADGKACAVGCLLTDELAHEADRLGLTISEIGRLKLPNALVEAIGAHDTDLLEALQLLHDRADGIPAADVLDFWRSEGADIARAYRVDPKVWTAPFDAESARR